MGDKDVVIIDKGPWRVSFDEDKDDIDIMSDDFTHDVMFTIDGDFKDLDEKRKYAENIVRRLNKE